MLNQSERELSSFPFPFILSTLSHLYTPTSRLTDKDSPIPTARMEKPPASSASSSSDDQTRIHATEASESKGFASEHDRVFGSSTTAEAPTNRSKTRLDYFSPDGELQRTVSRQESRFSNTTQDPFQDGFDFEKHLKQILRKVDDKGVATRQLGGELSISQPFPIGPENSMMLTNASGSPALQSRSRN